MRAIDDDGEPVQPVGQRGGEVRDIPGLAGAVVVDTADFGTHRPDPVLP